MSTRSPASKADAAGCRSVRCNRRHRRVLHLWCDRPCRRSVRSSAMRRSAPSPSCPKGLVGGLRARELRSGDAYQFDWIHEIFLIDWRDDDPEGRTYPSVLKADAISPGQSARYTGDGLQRPRQGIRLLRRGDYDNMKTVDTIFVGRDRAYTSARRSSSPRTSRSASGRASSATLR